MAERRITTIKERFVGLIRGFFNLAFEDGRGDESSDNDYDSEDAYSSCSEEHSKHSKLKECELNCTLCGAIDVEQNSRVRNHEKIRS